MTRWNVIFAEPRTRTIGGMRASFQWSKSVNAATAAELVRWLWALGMMCREGAE